MQVKVADPRVDTNPIRGVVRVLKKGVGTRMTCQHKVSNQSPPWTAYQILESVRTRIPGPVRTNNPESGDQPSEISAGGRSNRKLLIAHES